MATGFLIDCCGGVIRAVSVDGHDDVVGRRTRVRIYRKRDRQADGEPNEQHADQRRHRGIVSAGLANAVDLVSRTPRRCVRRRPGRR